MVWCGLLTLQLPPPSSPSTSWPHLLVSPDGLMWPSVASTTRLSITFAIIQQTHTFAGFRQTSKVHIFSLLFKGSKFRAGINKFPRYFWTRYFFFIQTLVAASFWTCSSSWQNSLLYRRKSFNAFDPLSLLFTRPRGRHNLVQPPPIPYPWSETWYALFSPPFMGWRNDARAVSSLRIHNKLSLVWWIKSTLWISRTYKLQNIFSYPWKVALAVLKSPIITQFFTSARQPGLGSHKYKIFKTEVTIGRRWTFRRCLTCEHLGGRRPTETQSAAPNPPADQTKILLLLFVVLAWQLENIFLGNWCDRFFSPKHHGNKK